jgi:hypothetical protein
MPSAQSAAWLTVVAAVTIFWHRIEDGGDKHSGVRIIADM